MEAFMKRGNDYPPEYYRREISGDSPKTPSGDSDDMDFNDVFGGPPRRFSMQEVRVRFSFGDSEEDKDSSPWIAIKEKPVFGEESTARRRRQGDDFFDDIFRVDESHGSPRRTDGLIGSNPGSRIMSPVRTFSPKAEPFGTSLPAQFSHPAKSTKIMEFPTFGSPDHSPHKMDNTTNGLNNPYSSSASLSRFSNQSIRAHEDIKNEALPVYRHSPLSRQASKNDTKSMDNNSSQFHFSIYKWAGKGVPMLIPLVGRNNLSTKDISFNDPSKNLEPESLKMESEEISLRGREVKTQENEKVNEFKQNLEIEQVKSVDGIGIEKKITNEIVEPEMKENKSRSPKRAQSKAGKIPKKNDGARIDSNRENIDEYSYQGNVTEKIENNSRTPERPKFEAGKNAKKNEGARIKGMVKDFVHVFNQEADPSPKANSQTKNSSSRWKTVNMSPKQNEVSPNAAKYDFSQPSSRVDENIYKDEVQKCTTTETSIHINDHFSTNLKSAYSSEPLNLDSKISVENSDDPFEDNFLVQELSDDLEKATQNDEVFEDLKDLDAKIRQWSFGRKGNIRSLLSTLQLVLWPGSGWKPVPLMDLIEANSVKRAYQKALLRLHPDKLQQKGADSHHKYIAEKVFDILQEAWDHFNTLAPI